MLVGIRQFLAAPVFEDEDKTRLAHLLNIFLWGVFIQTVILIIATPLVVSEPLIPLLILGLMVLPVEIFAFLLMRNGRIKEASVLLTFGLMSIITGTGIFTDGVRGPAFSGYIIIILVANFLLGGETGIKFVGLSLIAGCGLLYADLNGILPQSFVPITPVFLWVVEVSVIVIMALILHLATGHLNDITQEARRNEQDLAAEVVEREQVEKRLKVYIDKLEKGNQELQNFLYVASHDLREPLRKIQIFDDLLQTKCATQLDERGMAYLNRIHHSAIHMQALLDDLRAFSQATTEVQLFTPVDLNQVMQEVRRRLMPQVTRVNGRIEFSSLPTVEADQSQMEQLLQNLIENALKFRRQEEAPIIKVSANTLNAKKSCMAKHHLDKIELCQIIVEDNGIGFAPKHTRRIFQVFQRLHSRDDYEGNGVGLAIAQKIVDRHNGRIDTDSKPGEGTVFKITLPKTRPFGEICNE